MFQKFIEVYMAIHARLSKQNSVLFKDPFGVLNLIPFAGKKLNVPYNKKEPDDKILSKAFKSS